MGSQLTGNASAFVQLDIFDFLKAAEEPKKTIHKTRSVLMSYLSAILWILSATAASL